MRRDRDARIEKPQIVAVPRAAHQPMRTQDNRLPVAVLGAMTDAQDAQRNLEGGVAAIEYIVLEISRGRVLIPTEAKCALGGLGRVYFSPGFSR